MNQQRTVNAIVVAVTIVCVCLVVGSLVGEGDVDKVLMIIGAGGALALWTLGSNTLWGLAVASLFLHGNFTFLPLGFSPFEILIGLGICRFVIEQIVFEKKPLSIKERGLTWLIVISLVILLVHAFRDRFGMRVFGSDIWGGRQYVGALLGFVAFFVAQNLPLRFSAWDKVPYFVLTFLSIDTVITLAAKVKPGIGYALAPIYSVVPPEETILGPIGNDRPTLLGPLGIGVLLLVLSYRTWFSLLHPRNWLLGAAALGSLVASAASGFRSAVVAWIVVAGAGLYRDLKGRLLLSGLTFVALLTAFLGAKSVFDFELPQYIERSLSFLPGEWDPVMKNQTDSSNDFRIRILERWYNEMFPHQPWFGSGCGIDPEVLRQILSGGNSEDLKFELLYTSRQLHNGLASTVDAVGIIGSIPFIIFTVVVLFRILRFLKRGMEATQHPVMYWFAFFLFDRLINYWWGASDFAGQIKVVLPIAGIFLVLERTLRAEEKAKVKLDAPPSVAAEHLAPNREGLPRPSPIHA